MFKLSGVIGYLKNVLNYTYPQVLEFINTIPGECQGDDVMLKGSDIEKLLGVDELRKLECEVYRTINL
tara:strand:- start:2146 stop:2349 length:204 start_codon:yes stop_codon:yes gene_type:complete